MRKHCNRWIALGTLAAMTATTFFGVMPAAQASAKGKRNLTIGAAAVTAYGLLKHKKTVAIVGGVGTGLAYLSYRKAKKKERAENARRQAWYRQRYGRLWRNHYVPAG